MEFAIVGRLKVRQQEIEKKIRKLGGKVVSVIHDKLAAVIACQQDVQKMGFEMVQAKRYNIQVISADFLTEATTTDPMLYIISQSIADWGGDVRIDLSNMHLNLYFHFFYTFSHTLVLNKATWLLDELKNSIQNRYPTRSPINGKVTYNKIIHEIKKLEQSIYLSVKIDGCAVDPECGLEDNAHVYSQNGNNGRLVRYSVILGLVDIENDKNSYYRIQLLESNKLKL